MSGTEHPRAASPTVLVARQVDGSYVVKVRVGKVATSHVVSVPEGLAKAVGADGATEERMVRASFAFLLEREPATSVLPRFGLDVIPRYFPEYLHELGLLLQADEADDR